jgi:hypothetical protein
LELTEGNLRALRRWAKLFLAVAILTAFLGYFHQLYLRFNPAAERHYGRLVHISIGGRDFAIPSEYFRGPLPPEKTDRLHLWVMQPDYTPYRGEISGDRAHIDAGWERHLIVNIEGVSPTSGLDAHYKRQRSGSLAYVAQDMEGDYGLHRTLVWRSTPRSNKPFIDHDLYYDIGPDGRVTTFVSCMRDDWPGSPVCSFHEFQIGELLYTVSYRKSNLPKWRDIQQGVADLIEGFACSPFSAAADGRVKPCPR